MHYVPTISAGTSIKVNWPDIFHSYNYHDFHAALPKKHYTWPDTEALQNKINTTASGSRERALLIHHIDLWMNNLLDGTGGPRLWLKPGAKVYRTPSVDDDYAIPRLATSGDCN